MTVEKTWNFSTVADSFESHISNQLPWYHAFTQNILIEFARWYIAPNTVVYDIGASIGNVEMALEPILSERNIKFVAIEENIDMVTNYQGDSSNLYIGDALGYLYDPYSFCTSVLTLSFIHPSKRRVFIEQLKQKCMVGGAFMIVEKFFTDHSEIDTIQHKIVWKAKTEHFSSDAIIEKEFSLSGAQYPLRKSELGDGFVCVWQYGNFSAYIFTKETE